MQIYALRFWEWDRVEEYWEWCLDVSNQTLSDKVVGMKNHMISDAFSILFLHFNGYGFVGYCSTLKTAIEKEKMAVILGFL